MRIGADDPVIGERMNPPDEGVDPIETEPELAGAPAPLRWLAYVLALAAAVPFAVHVLWDVATVFWGYGG